MSKARSRLLNTIKAPVLDWLSLAGGGPGPFSPSPHPLSSGHHSGELANAQAPQFLLRDGSRSLTGNLAVESGILIDGVDLSAHVGDANAHHPRVHDINGADHTGVLDWAKVSKAGSSLNEIATRPHSHLTGIGANDHHNRQHGILTAADHTVTGSAWQVIGLTGANTLGLLDSSSNPGAAERLLRSTAAGGLTLEALTVRGNLDVINGGDLTIGTLIQANVTQGSVGFNRVPDPQFSVDVAGALRADWLIGPHAIQLSGALMICHYDGPGPFELDFTGTAVGHMGQAPTTETAIIYRPGKFGGKALQAAPTTTNLVTNPRFEIGLTGWATSWGDTLSHSTLQALYGERSCRIIADGSSGSGAWSNITVSAGLVYSGHLSIYLPSSWTGELPELRLYDGASFATLLGSVQVANVRDKWQRVTLTATPTETTIRITAFAPGTTTSGQFWYIDAVQLEQKAFATAYADGGLGPGHAWTGTAHASTSTRAAMALGYESEGNIKRDQGTVMCWAKATAVTSADQTLLRISNIANTRHLMLRLQATNRLRGSWGSGAAIGTTDIATMQGEWFHTAVTCDGTTVRVYLNGQEEASAAVGDAIDTLQATAWVGQFNNGTQAWNGRIDDLAIIDHALDPEQILAIYESSAPVFAESSTWHFQTPGDVPVWADERGLFVRDTEGGAVLGVIGRDASSWGGRSNDAGDLLIGDVNQGNYLLWDRDVATLTVAGKLLVLDDSEFVGVVGIGADGGIYQGSGSFATPTTGLKIWNDSGVGRLATFNGGTVQVEMNSTGHLLAGAGAVTLSNSGLTIAATGASPGDGVLRFASGSLLYSTQAFHYLPTSNIAWQMFWIDPALSPADKRFIFNQHIDALGRLTVADNIRIGEAKMGIHPLIQIGTYPETTGEYNGLAAYSEGEHVFERDQMGATGANGTVLGLRRRNMKDNENRSVLRIAHQSANNDPPNNSGRLGANIAWQGTGYDGVDVEMGWMGFHWTFASTSGSKQQGFYMGLHQPETRAIINFTTSLFEIHSDRLKWRAPNSAIADATLNNGEISFYLNEGGNQLVVKAKYSGGTVRTGTIALT